MGLQELLKLFHLLIWINKNAPVIAGRGKGRRGRGAGNTISLGGGSEPGSGSTCIIKLRPTWAVMGLNVSDLSLLPQGPPGTPHKGMPRGCLQPAGVGKVREAGRKPGAARWFTWAPSTGRSQSLTSGTVFPVPRCQAQEHAFHPVLYSGLPEHSDFD